MEGLLPGGKVGTDSLPQKMYVTESNYQDTLCCPKVNSGKACAARGFAAKTPLVGGRLGDTGTKNGSSIGETGAEKHVIMGL
jgi:hypothetical protein